MSDAIVVLNAGSSSIKFSLFLAHDGALAPDVRGQVEGLYTGSAHPGVADPGTTRAIHNNKGR